jgi:hypothetical protein
VCRTDSTSVTITRLEAERRREESVEVSETSEPPKTQLVKDTSTFLSFLQVKDMVAVEQGLCKGFDGGVRVRSGGGRCRLDPRGSPLRDQRCKGN